jgi:DNA-binding XRE family transcriptional regulator
VSKQRAFSRHTLKAVKLLGHLIKLSRIEKKWTEQNLADRADISRSTLKKIEKGEPGCSIGLVFELAALTEVILFDTDISGINKLIAQSKDKITLLPKRVQHSQKDKEVDDDF